MLDHKAHEARSQDPYDRKLAMLDGLPDVVSTRPYTTREVTFSGHAETWTVQTIRHPELGDSIFIECVSGSGAVRLALPAKIATAINRQRNSLSTKNRSRASRAAAQERMARGEVPFEPRNGREEE